MRTILRLAPVLTTTALLLAPVAVPADAQVASGTSDVGVVPFVPESGQGGNVACAELEALDGIAGVDLRTSGRLNWGGGGFNAPLPDGVTVTVTGGTVVAWTSTDFPLAAVIVKGGDAANVYVYTGLADDVFADGGLVAPANASGGPAGLSNLTLCWDAGWTPPDEPNLTQLCLRAAADADITDITWVTDPIEIRDGAVDLTTVPSGFTITFDPADEQVTFVAPDPVAIAVTAAPTPVTHLIVPPASGGTVPLSSNPGAGDLVLCGIASPPPVVEELSCDVVPDTVVVGPVPLVAGVVDPSDIPTGISSVEPNTTSIGFTATDPVAAVIVVASPPELTEFDPEVFEGSVAVAIDGQETIDLYFCVRSTSIDDPEDPDDPITPTRDPDDPAGDLAVGTLDDPTTIPTGGGPSGRTALALIAFVVLALAGSTTLLVWSRGG